jgi:hypothetical protein
MKELQTAQPLGWLDFFLDSDINRTLFGAMHLWY